MIAFLEDLKKLISCVCVCGLGLPDRTRGWGGQKTKIP
mgnify:CR=1 FL=1